MKDSIVDSDVVDAFCTTCKREVLVDHTRRCPDCEQLVDPRSLPRVTSRPALQFERVDPSGGDSPSTDPVRAGQLKVLTSDGEGFIDPPPAPAPRTAVIEPIVLPDWIKETGAWWRATEAYRAALEREEGQLVGELRRVRATLKLLDQIQERVTLRNDK